MGRRLKKKIRVILLIVIGILLVGGGLFLFKDKIFTTDTKTTIKKITTKKEVEVWPKVYTASMVATGDTVIHNPIYESAYDSTTGTYDFTPQLRLLTDIIPNYDIAYYNQETLFGGADIGYFSYPTFNSPSEFGDAMVSVGFNTVSLATNHSADCKGSNDTCLTNSYNYWASKNVVFDGFNEDETKENKYNIKTVNNITYGFLDYTDTLNGLDSTVRGIEYRIDTIGFTESSDGTCPEGYTYANEVGKCITSNLHDEVTDLRDKVDVLIVAVHGHYGSAEYSFTPTQINMNIAKYLNSMGVDIVLGTYSHCLQPFDIIENTDAEGNTHKTTVFYSLGNFISNQLDLNYSPYFMHPYVGAIGVLATMDITKTVEKDGTTTIEVGNLGADLIYSYHKNHKNYTVVPFSKMTDEYMDSATAQSVYEEYTGYLTSLNQNITIKAIGSANTQN